MSKDNYIVLNSVRSELSQESVNNLKKMQIKTSEPTYAFVPYFFGKQRLIAPKDDGFVSYSNFGRNMCCKKDTIDEVIDICEYTNVVKFNIKR